jgi:hypothetical protein
VCSLVFSSAWFPETYTWEGVIMIVCNGVLDSVTHNIGLMPIARFWDNGRGD